MIDYVRIVVNAIVQYFVQFIKFNYVVCQRNVSGGAIHQLKRAKTARTIGVAPNDVDDVEHFDYGLNAIGRLNDVRAFEAVRVETSGVDV